MVGTRLVHGEFTGGIERHRLPGEQVAHQVASRPAVRGVDRSLEIVVREIGERLERRPGVALLLEEFEGIEIHDRMVAAPPSV